MNVKTFDINNYSRLNPEELARCWGILLSRVDNLEIKVSLIEKSIKKCSPLNDDNGIYDFVDISAYDCIPKDMKIICEFSIIYYRKSNINIADYISFFDIIRHENARMYKLNNNYIITKKQYDYD